ncbi:MAG: MFS transporter [Anaerolineae bacterium]|nr:MFS transporter [Anaerolineae bacterium]
MSSSSLPQPRSLLAQVALLTTSRTGINTGFRMMYPLMPVFARGVNVEVTVIVSILTLMQLMGLVAPFLGRLSEQRGRKFTLLLGLALYAGGMAVVFVLPGIAGLALALLIGTLGKIAFDPAVQAYIGDRVPYERRGLYLGIVELGWSSAFIVGIPIMTWLIAQFNWQAPFAALGLVALVALGLAWWLLEADAPAAPMQIAFLPAVRAAVRSRLALAGLVLGFGISAANQLINVVFGTWIEESFGVQLAALAVAAAVIGLSELGGEGIVTAFADRFGKRRLVLLGIGGNILACLLLPLTGFDLNVALIGLFFFYLTFELSLVATIPLATELSPQSRAMYMTVIVASFTLGRAVFTPVASFLFSYGLAANSLLAVVLNVVALVAVWRFISVR